MKIVIVSNLFPPDYIGGYELGCCRIAQALSERGHEVVVATSRASGRAAPEANVGIRVERIFAPVREMLLRGHPQGSSALAAEHLMKLVGVDLPAMVRLHEFIAHERPDVIYLFNPIGLGPLGLMEAILGSAVPAVFHLMDNLDPVILTHAGSSGLLGRFARLKKGFTALACSRGCLKHNSALGDYAASTVVYGGIEESFSPKNPGREASDGVFRFVCTGQAIRHKGIPQLLAAFQSIRPGSPIPLQLHLVGRIGDEMSSDANRAGNGVVFHGHLSHNQVLEMLPRMDAGVYPLPDNEAYGYAPIECLSAGVPAILPRRAGCAEMLPDAYPLFISSRDNVDELASMMAMTARDGSMRQVALNDFASIRQRFSFADHTLPGIEKVLLGARLFRTAPDFRKTRAFGESVTAMAQTQPRLLFRSL